MSNDINLDDNALVRFLIVKKFNVSDAHKAILNWIKWKDEVKLDTGSIEEYPYF